MAASGNSGSGATHAAQSSSCSAARFARGHLARLQIVWPSQRSHFPQVVLALLLASVIALVVWGAQLFQS
jgi:hypothetical protein